MILVYFSLDGTILPLPSTFGGANPVYITFATFQAGSLSILAQAFDNTAYDLRTDIQFRYIIIPGGTPAKANLPDFNDYNAVVKFYGIDP